MLVEYILLIVIFFSTISSTIIYLFILKKQLGNKFNIIKFLLGTRDQECYSANIYKQFKKNPLLFDHRSLKYNI